MTQTELRLVGYFAKNTKVPVGWTASDHVKEICSISDCVNSSPPGWIDHWLHNDWGFFNTVMDARLVVPSGSAEYAVFAYRLLPVRFARGKAEPLKIDELTVEQVPPTFVSLGFDVVNKVYSAFFECSPLSCNYLANEVAVNEFCLIDDFGQAVSLADRCSREEPEPGPFYVLEVLRDAST